MARYQDDSKRRRAPVVRLLLLAAALAAAAMVGGTAARYWKEWSSGGSLVTAGNFYFASDELNGSLRRLTANAYDRAELGFSLRNYIVAGYPTESEMTYTCMVTYKDGDINVPVTDVRWLNSDSTTITAGVKEGELTGTFHAKEEGRDGSQSRSLICSIPVAAFGEKGDRELTVTAVASVPYAKTLTARVTLPGGDSGVKLVVTDPGAGAVAVTLYNTSGRELVGTLTWPTAPDLKDAPLVPDLTGDVVPDENGKVTIPADCAVSVIFLKKNIERHFSESDGFQFELSE